MLFNTLPFALFFAAVLVCYVLLQRRHRWQNLLLLAASYFFYGCWDWRFLGLILLSTWIDFACGLALDRRVVGGDAYARPNQSRRRILIVSVVANLGVLGFFKYYDFFATSCGTLLTSLGLGIEPRLLHVILPVGISFYTFQSLSYTIDVYRGRIRAQRRFIDFALFVAFFPQLVAGPIVRANEFLPQIAKPRKLTLTGFYEGGYLLLWGLFKKSVIADNLAVLVDNVFAQNPTPLGGTILVALYAFAIQIYCDFSGYTDMARGCAKMMGFNLPINFNLPYFASNPTDFWRRWHISLSTLLRDYLYIPLGGSRKGPRRTAINVMLTMLLGGLWHGAAWTFVIWGAYQGALLMIHRALSSRLARVSTLLPNRTRSLVKALTVIAFFHLVCVGWLFFRAESVSQIGEMLTHLAQPWLYWIIVGANSLPRTGVYVFLIYAVPLLALQLWQNAQRNEQVILRQPVYLRGVCYAIMLLAIATLGGGVDKPFIYFQF